MPITDEQIEAFRVKLDEVNREHYKDMKIPNYYGGIEAIKGRKNVKYAITTGGSRSVVCFVELETGNVLKAASWASPAKGVRGHIDTIVVQPVTSHWLYRR